MNCCEELKKVIREQLKEDIVNHNFDVGYVQGTKVVRIRSRLDLQEFWQNFKKSNLILWCDGLKCEDASDNTAESSSKKRKLQGTKEEEVQQFVEELMRKHGSSFTTMQFRIWADMVSGGLHSDTDNPPSTSMFTRAGNTSTNKKSQSINQVITEAANAITSSLSPRSTTSPAASTCGSPSKLIEDRSKLYKQLSELHNLKSANILTEQEYVMEKDTIMELLRKLKINATTS